MKRFAIVLLALLCAAGLAVVAVLYVPQLIAHFETDDAGDDSVEAAAASDAERVPAPEPGKTSDRSQARREAAEEADTGDEPAP